MQLGDEMTKRFLVFQHMPWEGPGDHLICAAKKHGILLCVVEVWHEPIPDLSSYDGLIVLGGEPNIDQEQKYPFLKAEKAAIRYSIELGKPYLGFCLGHQLLADALGAKVGPNDRMSVGFIPGEITEKGRIHPLFRDVSDSFPLFKWHSQAVQLPLPKHVEILATSTECQVEAISVHENPRLVGLQFDNHAATITNVREWIKSDQEWLSQIPDLNPEAILDSAARLETLIGKQFEVMFHNFLELTPT